MNSPAPYVGRFAPTPNGPMHAGTAAAALLARAHARAAGGRFLLRWDDLDPLRCRAEWIDSLRADLLWLGVDWDAEVHQSRRRAAYEPRLLALAGRGLVYPCRCSRADVRRRTDRAYDGRCRADAFRDADPAAALLADPGRSAAERPALRLLRPDGDGSSDPVIWSREGHPAYTFASALDENDLGVTHVVRGEDLAGEAGPQSAVLSLLGRPVPEFVHFPLVRDPAGGKLSKSAGAPPLRERWSGDAAAFRDWVGRAFFDPPVGGADLPAGWRSSRLRAPEAGR